MTTTATLSSDVVREAARGRWRSTIYPELGIAVGTGKHGPCPACGGKDRFRCDDKDGSGSHFCNRCGAGHGLSLVMKVRNCDFPEALQLVAGVLNHTPSSLSSRPRPIPKPKPPRVSRRRIALDFELHAILLQERAEKTFHAASGLDCTSWSGADFDKAMDAVGRAHDDLAYAQVLFDVADDLRLKAFQEEHR